MEMGTKKLFFFVAILFSASAKHQVLAAKKTYIVYLGAHSYGLDASPEDHELATHSHHELLGSYLGSIEKAKNAMIYSYTKIINGFAARLEEEEAKQIEKNPHVLLVFESTKYQLHTTRSWGFMNLVKEDGEIPHHSIWAKAKFGRDVIISNLDTGVWPESKSFSDKGMGPVPARWRGFCENNTKDGVPCNRKLIGAKYFDKDAKANSDPTVSLVNSTRDTEGHGTHTLSTAAGRFVPGANLVGFGNGTASGGSPLARAAAYKVCYENGCYTGDIFAAFEGAIHDGVDVISVSLGGSNPVIFNKNMFFHDALMLGSLHATMHGITVVISAGNSGPFPSTVTNIAPWMLTAGASTIDREFPSPVQLANNKTIPGTSYSTSVLKPGEFYPLINATDAAADESGPLYAQWCTPGKLDPKKVKGKIVVCTRGMNERLEKGEVVKAAGGAGMILANSAADGDDIMADFHVLPATMITFDDSLDLYSFMNSTENPQGTITPPSTKLGTKPAPVMAAFSSRGPNYAFEEILKPDITAPGVNILAAFTEYISPAGVANDTTRVPYDFMSGTSMSCPHVSGIVGLVKAAHPHWSPAMIKSAIMTTATTKDNTGAPIKDADKVTEATPFAYGAGHVRPNKAVDPGLVYDTTMDDYFNFLCTLGYSTAFLKKLSKGHFKCPAEPVQLEDLNYPSIAVPALNKTLTVTRRLKNVGSPGTYKVQVHAPDGIDVAVNPPVLNFKKVGHEKTFKVTLVSKKAGRDYVFGSLNWSDGRHHVRSPLAVKALM